MIFRFRFFFGGFGFSRCFVIGDHLFEGLFCLVRFVLARNSFESGGSFLGQLKPNFTVFNLIEYNLKKFIEIVDFRHKCPSGHVIISYSFLNERR